MENRPECEICGDGMGAFEVAVALDTFGSLVCYACMDEDE